MVFAQQQRMIVLSLFSMFFRFSLELQRSQSWSVQVTSKGKGIFTVVHEGKQLRR